jgi:hypothetical protein
MFLPSHSSPAPERLGRCWAESDEEGQWREDGPVHGRGAVGHDNLLILVMTSMGSGPC